MIEIILCDGKLESLVVREYFLQNGYNTIEPPNNLQFHNIISLSNGTRNRVIINIESKNNIVDALCHLNKIILKSPQEYLSISILLDYRDKSFFKKIKKWEISSLSSIDKKWISATFPYGFGNKHKIIVFKNFLGYTKKSFFDKILEFFNIL